MRLPTWITGTPQSSRKSAAEAEVPGEAEWRARHREQYEERSRRPKYTRFGGLESDGEPLRRESGEHVELPEKRPVDRTPPPKYRIGHPFPMPDGSVAEVVGIMKSTPLFPGHFYYLSNAKFAGISLYMPYRHYFLSEASLECVTASTAMPRSR